MVRNAVPGLVQAAKGLLHRIFGRLPVPEHEEREPGQPQRMLLVDRSDCPVGVHSAVFRVTVRAVRYWRHSGRDPVMTEGEGTTA